MSTIQTIVAIVGIAFLLIFLLGYLVSHKGKPYNAVLFNIHKLFALGVFIYLTVTVVKSLKTHPLNPLHIAVIIFTALCFVSLAATGAVMSIKDNPPKFVRLLHRTVPYLTLISACAVLYLIFF